VTLLLGSVLSAAPAQAYHSDEVRLTDRSAHALQQWDFRVGVWKAEVGLLNGLQVTTYTLPWIFKMVNAFVKYEIVLGAGFSIAPRLGIFRLDSSSIDEDMDPIVLTIAPFELTGSYRFSDFTASLGIIYTFVGVAAELEESEIRGAVAVTNLQLTSTLEWRLNRVTALELHARYLAFQDVSASTSTTVDIDDYTSLEVHGAIESDIADVSNAFSIVPSIAFSWGSFNLRLGLGYGNFNVPAVNFVVPVATVVPDFDLYWRW